MGMKQAPYKHPDGSNCWTKNCKLSQPKVIRVPVVRDANGLSEYQTEKIGISAEIAIADAYNVKVNEDYRNRGIETIANTLTAPFLKAMQENNIPLPVAHVAENGNPVDFQLEGNQTLSVKTNMRDRSEVAPQRLGQPSAAVFWREFPELLPAGLDVSKLTYERQAQLFKTVAVANASSMLKKYWNSLFDCDYLVYANNFLTGDNQITGAPEVKIFRKTDAPEFDPKKITTSKSVHDWNESNTVYYDGVRIGAWQVHSNRDCFKFRFNLNGLEKAGLI